MISINKKIFISLSVLLSISIFAQTPEAEKKPKKIAVLSIPKSGTHLLTKAVKLITGLGVEGIINHDSFDFKKYSKINKDYAMAGHLMSEFNVLKSDPDTIKILMIRDLRDICVSAKFWLEKKEWYSHWCDHSSFYKKSDHDRLSYMIQFPKKYFKYSIAGFAKRSIKWMKEPDVYVCRFENLIGSEGGGDRELQVQTISELAAHLKVELSSSEIEEIADKLWGKSKTFRKGKTGSWRESYSPYQVNLAKKSLGDALIQMGYEEDLEW